MSRMDAFGLADPLFFETIERLPISDDYSKIVGPLLPREWFFVRKDIWAMGAYEGAEIPDQGFKIHLSSSLACAEEMLSLVVPLCGETGVTFKYAADPNILAIMSSKNYSRGSSSKFMVLYPRSLREFKELIERLDEITSHLRGAYVLSDRRYRESKVVYYRYGGFLPSWQLRVDGARTAVIKGRDGEPVPDVRLPYFKLPPWVDEPFGDAREVRRQEEALLGGRYKPVKALAFSNSGGVYEAIDTKTDRKVVIKEARPLTGLWPKGDGTYLDSVDLLRNEHAILSRLEGTGGVVRVRDLFQEWEHTFLVENFVEGLQLSRFRGRRQGNLLPFTGDREIVEVFCTNLREIALSLLTLVDEVHQRGVLLGDLSPHNVLIEPESLKLTLIDVESAISPDSDKGLDFVSRVWSTPGFRQEKGELQESLTEQDDFYAVAMILNSFLLAVTTLGRYQGACVDAIYDKIETCVGLPLELRAVIRLLTEGRVEEARRQLQAWDVPSSLRTPRTEAPAWEGQPLTDDRLLEAAEEIASFVVAHADSSREDRLFPADSAVFRTNPLALAHGAAGVSLFLQQVRGEIPKEVEGWLLSCQINNDEIPPGLFTGSAGIAYTFAQLGHIGKGCEVLEISKASDLLSREDNFFEGLAGWGWVCLYFYRRTEDEKFKEWAAQAADVIIGNARRQEEGLCWERRLTERIPYGLAYGATGIAMFLASAFETTGMTRFREAALQAIEYDLSKALQVDDGIWWGRWAGDELKTPYWLRGSGGIGAALLRISESLAEPKYLRLAKEVAGSAFAQFSVEPGLHEGLAGTGEFLLDMYVHTGEDVYREQALQIADSLLRFAIRRPEGLAIPGRMLIRLSTDLATGSAGVGLFLHRLSRPGPRLFHDLDAEAVSSSPSSVTVAATS